MFTAIKYRAYPNREQQRLLTQLFGNQRFIWNQLLMVQKDRIDHGERLLSRFDMQARIPQLMAQYPWLQMSKVDALRCAADALDAAFARWRQRIARFPQFKKRKRGGSVMTVQPGRAKTGYVWFARSLQIPIVEHKSVGGKLKRLTIKCSPSGRYYASCLYEMPVQDAPILDPKGIVGIDDGLESLITLSTGRKIRHGRHLKRHIINLRRQQRFLSRKQKGSRRRERQKVRVARLHEKIANARSYQTHLITTNLVRKAARESQAVAYQKSAIAGMMKNHRLAMAISDAGWGEMRRQLEYKCNHAGVPLYVVDQWQATTKTCSVCGHRLESLPLHVRKWKCPDCGVLHDRDVNAAINIANIARREASGLPVEGFPSMLMPHALAQGSPLKREGAVGIAPQKEWKIESDPLPKS